MIYMLLQILIVVVVISVFVPVFVALNAQYDIVHVILEAIANIFRLL